MRAFKVPEARLGRYACILIRVSGSVLRRALESHIVISRCKKTSPLRGPSEVYRPLTAELLRDLFQQRFIFSKSLPMSRSGLRLLRKAATLFIFPLSRFLLASHITYSYGRLPLVRMKQWRTDPPSSQPHPLWTRTYLNSFFFQGELQRTPPLHPSVPH